MTCLKTAGAVLMLAALLSASAAPALAPPPSPAAGNAWARILQSLPQPQHASCCRICRRGYACGNSCISRDRRCHQPTGCACNG